MSLAFRHFGRDTHYAKLPRCTDTALRPSVRGALRDGGLAGFAGQRLPGRHVLVSSGRYGGASPKQPVS